MTLGSSFREARCDLEPDPLARPRIQGLPVHHPVGARIRFAPRTAKEISA